MQLTENINMSLGALKAHKLRSALAILCIVIGIAAIIGMMTIIKGLDNQIKEQLNALSANTFQVQKNPAIRMGPRHRRYRNRKNITMVEARAIEEQCPAVKLVGPEVWRFAQTVVYKGKKTNPSVFLAGGVPAFAPNNGYFVDEGRFITDDDVEHNRQVIVLGMDVVEKLFPFSDPLGEEVKIRGHRFRVIGVFEEKGSTFGQSQDNYVTIPITAFFKLFGTKRSLNITVQAWSAALFETAQEQVIGVLRRVRKVPPGKPNDFEVWSSNTLKETFDNFTRAIKLVIVAICSIALLVGGIIIMNIMLVSVTERTREIGICKAIGAKRGDILWQFITEAIILCGVGGLIGVFLGVGIGELVGALTPLSAAVPLWSVLLALGFSSLVGLFFGIWPAAKAARLDPIEALRYE